MTRAALRAKIEELQERFKKPLVSALFSAQLEVAAEQGLQQSFLRLLESIKGLLCVAEQAAGSSSAENQDQALCRSLLEAITAWLLGKSTEVSEQKAPDATLFCASGTCQASDRFLAKFRHKIWRLLEAVLLFDETRSQEAGVAPEKGHAAAADAADERNIPRLLARLRDHVLRCLQNAEHGGSSISFEKGLALLALDQSLRAPDPTNNAPWRLHELLTKWWNGAVPVQSTRVEHYQTCAAMFYGGSSCAFEFICFLRIEFSTLSEQEALRFCNVGLTDKSQPNITSIPGYPRYQRFLAGIDQAINVLVTQSVIKKETEEGRALRSRVEALITAKLAYQKNMHLMEMIGHESEASDLLCALESEILRALSGVASDKDACFKRAIALLDLHGKLCVCANEPSEAVLTALSTLNKKMCKKYTDEKACSEGFSYFGRLCNVLMENTRSATDLDKFTQSHVEFISEFQKCSNDEMLSQRFTALDQAKKESRRPRDVTFSSAPSMARQSKTAPSKAVCERRHRDSKDYMLLFLEHKFHGSDAAQQSPLIVALFSVKEVLVQIQAALRMSKGKGAEKMDSLYAELLQIQGEIKKLLITTLPVVSYERWDSVLVQWLEKNQMIAQEDAMTNRWITSLRLRFSMPCQQEAFYQYVFQDPLPEQKFSYALSSEYQRLFDLVDELVQKLLFPSPLEAAKKTVLIDLKRTLYKGIVAASELSSILTIWFDNQSGYDASGKKAKVVKVVKGAGVINKTLIAQIDSAKRTGFFGDPQLGLDELIAPIQRCLGEIAGFAEPVHVVVSPLPQRFADPFAVG